MSSLQGVRLYTVVNTIRWKLKLQGETRFWTEIVWRMSTQKIATSEAVNAANEKIKIRLCSEPTKAAKDIMAS